MCTCSNVFSFNNFVSLCPTYYIVSLVSTLKITDIYSHCPSCTHRVRPQRKHNRRIWIIIPFLILPIILCFRYTCSPIARPLLLSRPSDFHCPYKDFFDPLLLSSYLHSFLLLCFQCCFLVWLWKNTAKVSKWKTELEESFQGKSKKKNRQLCCCFSDTLVTHSEGLPHWDIRWLDRRKPSGVHNTSEDAGSLYRLKHKGEIFCLLMQVGAVVSLRSCEHGSKDVSQKRIYILHSVMVKYFYEILCHNDKVAKSKIH